MSHRNLARIWTLGLLLLAGAARSADVPARLLRIYFIDVEGGQSTLVVTATGKSLLIDAGFAGAGAPDSKPGDPARARDPNRILAAMKDAGVARLDYVLVTHFHRDHMGGIPELAQLVSIGAFIDYGDAYPAEQRGKPEADAMDVAAYEDYVRVRAGARHVQPRPGDTL